MIAFVTIGTNKLKSSSEFYDKILLPFSIVQVDSDERYIGYANIDDPEDIQLYIMKPYNKEVASIGNGTMIAFLADSKKIVDQFHSIALKNGGIDEGSPGPRHGTDYYAYIRDLDGNKICAYTASKI
jgi:predicted lactoylglutathione lyase